MGMFDHFPYTNFHELNLDWILQTLKEIETTMDQFVAINSLKYADPIQWTIIRQYAKNTIVIDPLTGTAYISVHPVPSGVLLTNTYYWSIVFDLGGFIRKSAKNLTSNYEEETTLTATFPTAVNDWLVWGEVLYKVISPITAGDQYVIGSNISHFTIEDIIGHLNDLQTTAKNNLVAAINEVIDTFNEKIGSLEELNTTDQSSIVNAINEVIQTFNDMIGSLEDMDTSDKSSIVNAINEVIQTFNDMIGSFEDLDTSDKSSVVNAINSLIDDLGASITTLKAFVGTDPDGWVAAHRGQQLTNDTLIGSSPNGKTGVAGFTRTKDNPNSFDYGTIAVTGIAQSDKEEADTCVSWAGYFENRRIGDSSTAYGIEVDTGRFDTTQEILNPYSRSSDQNMCVSLNISSGCGDNDSTGADTAIWIHKNPVPFKQGIVFSEGAVASGRPAMLLPWGKMIAWQAGANDTSMMQFITGAQINLREINTPYYPKINFNNSDGLTQDVPEHSTLGAIEFSNNGTKKVEIRGTEDNNGTLTVLLPNSKYALLNQYWLSLPGMWVNCSKLEATTAEVSGSVLAGTVVGDNAYIDKSYKAGLYDHSVPTSTVRAIATALKNALKPVWVNNKCSMSVKREDIITIFSNNNWDATATNLLTGENQEYVDQAELALWIAYAP